jgi:hypothetical protein
MNKISFSPNDVLVGCQKLETPYKLYWFHKNAPAIDLSMCNNPTYPTKCSGHFNNEGTIERNTKLLNGLKSLVVTIEDLRGIRDMIGLLQDTGDKANEINHLPHLKNAQFYVSFYDSKHCVITLFHPNYVRPSINEPFDQPSAQLASAQEKLPYNLSITYTLKATLSKKIYQKVHEQSGKVMHPPVRISSIPFDGFHNDIEARVLEARGCLELSRKR